jgi:hypothetical protein
MYCVFLSSELFKAYVNVSRRFNVPFLYHKKLCRSFDPDQFVGVKDAIVKDIYEVNPGVPESSCLAYYISVVETIKPGLNLLLVHPGFDNPELREVAKDKDAWHSAWRQRDFDVLVNPAFKSALSRNAVVLTNWRQIPHLLAQRHAELSSPD